MILEPDENLIRMRPHMSSYEGSMKFACYIAEDKDVLAWIHCFLPAKAARLEELTQRFFGLDHRNGWHSWLVSLRGSPVIWTDREVPAITLLQSIGEVSGIHLPP